MIELLDDTDVPMPAASERRLTKILFSITTPAKRESECPTPIMSPYVTTKCHASVMEERRGKGEEERETDERTMQ